MRVLATLGGSIIWGLGIAILWGAFASSFGTPDSAMIVGTIQVVGGLIMFFIGTIKD